jgi:transposase-like protein
MSALRTGVCIARAHRYRVAVMETASVQCPFCGQAFELAVDTSVPSQRFTTDCEVCCRPFEVQAECEEGEILSLDVLGAS